MRTMLRNIPYYASFGHMHTNSSIGYITELEDPRLEPFREIRNRTWTHPSGIFIAEGPLLVQRLLESDYGVRSLLIDAKHHARYSKWASQNEVELLMMDSSAIETLTGFDFHRGILGCGIRKPLRNVQCDFGEPPAAHETLVGIVGVQDQENLGSILRSCAALGVRRVLIGPGTCDPLARRALRVSMGSTLSLELIQSNDIVADMQWLKSRYQLTSIATSLDEDSLPLEQVSRESACLLLFGSERDGLPSDIQRTVDRKVKIDMHGGVDSLNVGVAAGIFLHHFCKR